MLLDWDLTIPWYIGAAIGFGISTIISFFLFSDAVDKSNSSKGTILALEEELARANSTIENYKIQILLHEEYASKASALIESNLKSRLASLDSYRDAWNKVGMLLKTLTHRLDDHESANVMERSLIVALRSDLSSAINLTNGYLLEGIDPNGTVRKTVKIDTSGGNSDAEERIQAPDKESEKH